VVTPDDFSITVRNIKVLKDQELQNVDYEKELDKLFEDVNEKLFNRSLNKNYITDIILCYHQSLFKEDNDKLKDLV
jgi:ribonuclease I